MLDETSRSGYCDFILSHVGVQLDVRTRRIRRNGVNNLVNQRYEINILRLWIDVEETEHLLNRSVDATEMFLGPLSEVLKFNAYGFRETGGVGNDFAECSQLGACAGDGLPHDMRSSTRHCDGPLPTIEGLVTPFFRLFLVPARPQQLPRDVVPKYPELHTADGNKGIEGAVVDEALAVGKWLKLRVLLAPDSYRTVKLIWSDRSVTLAYRLSLTRPEPVITWPTIGINSNRIPDRFVLRLES